jgi:uncharacterized membrane protein YdjX (TVP38/TMEM64 family)
MQHCQYILNREREFMNLSLNREKIQTVLVLLMAFGLSLWAVLFTSRNPEMIEAFVRQTGFLGPAVIVGLYGLLGVSPIPSEALSLITGAVYGPFLGTFLSFTGNMLAAVIEYYIGSHIGTVADFEEQRKKLPFGLGRFPANSPWFLIFGRLVPGYGGKLVSVIGGIYKVPMWRYIWTAAIPTFVGSAVFVFGGSVLVHGF